MKKMFQFTPLREGRQLSLTTTGRESSFQFTPLREGRLDKRIAEIRSKKFQFTPLREGRQKRMAHFAGNACFNSRPCVRGDINALQTMLYQGLVSIHAPA